MCNIKKHFTLCCALLAALSLSIQSYAQPPSNQDDQTQKTSNQDNQTQKKTIRIFNNTPETIYPIIEVSNNNQDANSVRIYRIYVHELPPSSKVGPEGSSVIVTLPNNMPGEDSNLTWLNGGRIYIYDQKPPSGGEPVAKSPDGFPIYQSKTGFPPEDPFQLVEYTMDQDPDGTQQVDYDISYVDHLYLPVNVEVNDGGVDGNVGYNGSGDMTLADFQSQLRGFAKQVNWPHYNPPPLPKTSSNTIVTKPKQNIKLPGGYNLFAEDEGLSFYYPGQPLLIQNKGSTAGGNKTTAQQKIIDTWSKWKDPSVCNTQDPYKDKNFCTAFQSDINAIWGTYGDNNVPPKGFAGDAKKRGLPPQSDKEIIKHIIGYVGFNDASGHSDINYLNDQGINLKWISDAEGLPYTTDTKTIDRYIKQGRKYPDFDSLYNLNPYVTFVHRKDFLNMNVYGFSIDDAVGNVREPGNGFTIAVGGLRGITNQTPYVPDYAYRYRVSPAPGWTQLTVCSKAFSMDPKVPIARAITTNTCKIELTAPQDPQTGVSQTVNITSQVDEDKGVLTIVDGSCSDSMNQLCTGNQFNVDPTGKVLNTPPPSAGSSSSIGLYWLPPSAANPPATLPWKSATVCGTTLDVNAMNKGSVPINSPKCDIKFTADKGDLSFTAVSTNGTWSVSTDPACSGSLSSLCSAITTDPTQKSSMNVPTLTSDTPVNPVNPIKADVYWGLNPPGGNPNWASVKACGTAAEGGHVLVTTDNCAMTFQAPSGNVTFTVTGNPATIKDCTGTGTLCNQVQVVAPNVINVPALSPP